MKEIEIIFPKGWFFKVSIFKFTEKDILKISTNRVKISKIKSCTYLVSGKEEMMEEVFEKKFIERLKQAGLSIKILN